MIELSSRDLRAALDSAAALAEVEDAEDLPAVALAGLRRLVPCESSSYNEVNLAGGPARVVTDGGDPPSNEGLAAFGRLAPQNPLISYYAASGDGAPVMFSDFLSLPRLRSLEIHSELYRDLEIDHQLACALTAEPSVIGIALNRSQSDFDERDRALLDLMRPHLAASLRRVSSSPRPKAGPPAERLAELTRRERQVAGLAAQGMTNREIALALVISPKTVNAHLERIYRKLGVRRRAQLMTLFHRGPGATS